MDEYPELNSQSRADLLIFLAELCVVRQGVPNEEGVVPFSIELHLLNMADEALTRLRAILPQLADLDKSMKSAVIITKLAGAPDRLRAADAQERSANALRLKGPNFEQVMQNFRETEEPINNQASLLAAFKRYLRLGSEILEFCLHRFNQAKKICAQYRSIIPVVNSIPEKSNLLILSRIEKSEAYEFCNNLQDLLEELSNSVSSYFLIAMPQTESFNEVRSCFLAGDLIMLEDEQLSTLDNYDSLNTLDSCLMIQPHDVKNFGEILQFRKKLSEFLNQLNIHKDDSTVSAKKMLLNKNEQARSLKEKVEKAINDPLVSLIHLKVLKEDFSNLIIFLNEQANHVSWSVPLFPFSMDTAVQLKESLLKKIEEANKNESERADQQKALNRGFLTAKNLPKISKSTWSRFLRLWKLEVNNLQSESIKLSALKSSLSNQQDIITCETMTNIEEVMNFLLTKYGTVLSVSTKLLESLESGKGTQANLDAFLMDTLVSIGFIKSERQFGLIYPERLLKIINSNFNESICQDFSKLMLLTKNQCKAAFVPSPELDNFETAWQTSYGSYLLDIFKDFLTEQIDLRRNMATGKTNVNSKSGTVKKVSSDFKCLLCKTGHLGPNNRPRKFMSACEIFLSYSVPQRMKFINSNDYCYVCLCYEKDGNRKNKKCSLLSKLACKACDSQYPHHTLLCRKNDGNYVNYGQESSPDDDQRGNGRGKRKHHHQYRPVRGGGKTLSIIYETNKPIDRKQCRVPFGVFLSKLNLLLQSLYFLSVHEENYAFRAKCKDHLNDSWLDKTFNLQAVFACRVMMASTLVSAITLSDTGATLSFVTKNFVKKYNLKPSGQWKGNLQTLTNSQKITTDFFKLVIKVPTGSKMVLCLLVDTLGMFHGLPEQGILKFASFFGIDVRDLFNEANSPIDLLIGVDSVGLLLNRVESINGNKLISPLWAPDVSVFKSIASPKFSLVGKINPGHCKFTDNVKKCSGIFYFNTTDEMSKCRNFLDESGCQWFCQEGMTDPTSAVSLQLPIHSYEESDDVCSKFTRPEMSKLTNVGIDIQERRLSVHRLPNSVRLAQYALALCLSCMAPLTLGQKEISPPIFAVWKDIGDNKPEIDDLRRQQLCSQCTMRSRHCPQCTQLSKEISLEKIRENQCIINSLQVRINADGTKCIALDYPLKVNPHEAYSAKNSNYAAARNNSRKLLLRLKKNNLFEAFDNQVKESIEMGHMRFLSRREINAVLKGVHNFTSINYVMKETSSSTPIRIVSNSSFPHRSGSLNQNCIGGETVLPPLINLVLNFLLSPYIACFDLSKCYRSVVTNAMTNNLRLVSYWTDFQDADCSSVLMYNVMTFGDAAASTILMMSYLHIILPHLTNELSKWILSRIYVDDCLAGHHDKYELKEAVLSLLQVFSDFGFKAKFHIFNWLPLPPEVDDVQNVFHMVWNVKQDMMMPQICLNVHPKSRGQNTGPLLHQMENLHNIRISKTLVARLLGQLFSLDGFLAPIRCALLSTFSKICAVLKSWKETLPKDHELAVQCLDILEELRVTIPNIMPTQRLKIPLGTTVRAIYCFTDASVDIVCFAIYLVTAAREGSNSQSRFLYAGNFSRHGSVPSLELLAFSIGLTEIYNMVLSHQKSIFNDHQVDLYLLIDSMCTIHSLNVQRISKSILQRNVKNQCQSVITQITKMFPLMVRICYIDTANQTADLGTKRKAGMIDIINSVQWRTGAKDGLLKPILKENIYMEGRKGQFEWVKNELPDNCQTCGGDLCGLGGNILSRKATSGFYDLSCRCNICTQQCWTKYAKLIKDHEHQSTDISHPLSFSDIAMHDVYLSNICKSVIENSMISMEEIHAVVQAAVSDADTHGSLTTEQEVGNQVLVWEKIIAWLPRMSENYWQHLFNDADRTPEILLSSVARVLLCVLRAFPKSKDMSFRTLIDPHHEMEEPIWKMYGRNGQGAPLVTKVLSAFSTNLLRLSWFWIVKTSQSLFTPPQDPKGFTTIDVGGCIFAKTRYSSGLMINIFNTPLLPIVPKYDVKLKNIILRDAHQVKMPEDGSCIHLPADCTGNRVLAHKLTPCYTVDLRREVTRYIRECGYCNRQQAKRGTFRSFLHELQDPWVTARQQMFSSDTSFFSKISVDAITIKVRRREAEKVASVPMSILFGVDAYTSYFFYVPLKDLRTSTLAAAFNTLFMRFAYPKIVICDAFASFKELAKENIWPGVKIRPRMGGEQLSNFVESTIKTMKKMQPQLTGNYHTAITIHSRLELICAVLNSRPVKKVQRSDCTFTLSAKEMLYPVICREDLRANLMLTASRLQDTISWDEYRKQKTDAQHKLQEHLLAYLYHESSWRYKLCKGGGGLDGELLTPEQGDIVAVKTGDSYRLALIVGIKELPRAHIRILRYDKPEVILCHVQRMGLIYRDPKSYTDSCNKYEERLQNYFSNEWGHDLTEEEAHEQGYNELYYALRAGRRHCNMDHPLTGSPICHYVTDMCDSERMTDQPRIEIPCMLEINRMRDGHSHEKYATLLQATNLFFRKVFNFVKLRTDDPTDVDKVRVPFGCEVDSSNLALSLNVKNQKVVEDSFALNMVPSDYKIFGYKWSYSPGPDWVEPHAHIVHGGPEEMAQHDVHEDADYPVPENDHASNVSTPPTFIPETDSPELKHEEIDLDQDLIRDYATCQATLAMPVDPCAGQAWDSPLHADVEMKEEESKEEIGIYVKQEPLSPQILNPAPLFFISPQPDQPETFSDNDPLAQPGSSTDL